jgi:hypothetical protein
MTNNQPIHRVSAGQVAAAIWDNTIEIRGRPRRLLKASVTRRYKDPEGRWQTSSSFSRNEIPLVIHCLQRAFEYILEADADGKLQAEADGA